LPRKISYKACPKSSRTPDIRAKSKKNRVKKREKNTFFLVFFFTFAKIETNITRDQICTFSIFGVHVVKQNMIFYTFFGIFVISHLILRNKKCMTNSKKMRFLAFCPRLLNKKSFFQHFFDEKIFNFQFPPHYNKFHFFLFFMLILRQTSKKTSKKLTFFQKKLKKSKFFFCSQSE
jgi:hypothetical protein